MGYNLQIIFTGVVALVPDRPIFVWDGQNWRSGAKELGSLDFLLPDLRQPQVFDLGCLERQVIREAHHAAFTFDWPNLRPTSTRTVDARVALGQPVREKGIVLLERECVRLNLSPEDRAGRRLQVVNDVAEEQPKPLDSRSLWWVPAMERIERAASYVDPRNDPRSNEFAHGDGAKVVGAFLADVGTVSVAGFNRERVTNDPTVWSFEVPCSSPDNLLKRLRAEPEAKAGLRPVEKQAIGNRLMLEVRGLEREIGFEFGFFEGREMVVESELRLGPPAGFADTVTVEVANKELDQLVHTLTRGPVRRAFSDPDFLGFYDLCTDPTTIPDPKIPTRPGGFLGPDERPCAPTLMTGYGRT